MHSAQSPDLAPSSSAGSPGISSHPSRTYHASFGPTGFRRGFTEEDATPEDAPVKPRRYLVSSRTARRDVPNLSEDASPSPTVSPPVDSDPGNRLDPPDARLKEKIERQRLKNTLSARRSRARKLETMESLRCQKTELEQSLKEKDVALIRALGEAASCRAMVESLNEQLRVKSSEFDELKEAKNSLWKDMLAMRAERNSLTIPQSPCCPDIHPKAETADPGGGAWSGL